MLSALVKRASGDSRAREVIQDIGFGEHRWAAHDRALRAGARCAGLGGALRPGGRLAGCPIFAEASDWGQRTCGVGGSLPTPPPTWQAGRLPGSAPGAQTPWGPGMVVGEPAIPLHPAGTGSVAARSWSDRWR